MFLLIVGHKVGIRLIVDHFQHSTEIVDRQFKETIRTIRRLGKINIHPFQSNKLHPHIANNTKFFSYFKVISNYCSFYYTYINYSHIYIYVYLKVETEYLLRLNSCCAISSSHHWLYNYYFSFYFLFLFKKI